MRRLLLALPLLLLFCTISNAQAPVLFFTDLTTGTATGNSDTTFSSTGGVYVTLYGSHLDNFTSIKLNGASCLTVVSGPSAWLWYERMVVKIGTSCSSGNFSITTPRGTFSGPMLETAKAGSSTDFTVNSGHIYYVSTTGNDSNSGTFQSPFATLYKGKITLIDGDVLYAENGVSMVTTDPDGAGSYSLTGSACGQSTWRALAAYPGATVTLGSISQDNAIRPGFSAPFCNGNYIFSGITIRGLNVAINLILNSSMSNFRLVGNDVSCPNANQETGCLADGGSTSPFVISNIETLGNNFHDVGVGNNGLQHAVYHGNTVSIVDAWNKIINVSGACRGIQLFSSTSGFVHTDVHLHDNLIHDTGCDGIGMYDTNPSATTGKFGGGAEIYNNVVYNTGQTGPGGADSACIYVAADSSPSGTDEVYNNTLFNCQFSNSTSAGLTFNPAGDPSISVHFHNNIISLQNSSVLYVENQGVASQVFGTNNLAFGNGAISSSTCQNCGSLTGWVNSNPGFVNTSTSGCPDSCVTNLALSSSSSPANGAGSTTAPVPTYDHTGVIRPSPPAIGAYEFAAGTFYAQATVGAGNGVDCADAKALPIVAGDWVAGNTIHLCGTITFPVGTTGIPIVGRNGTSSNPITVLAEPGLVLQSPKFSGCADGPAPPGSVASEGGAIDISSTSSFIILDGGTNGIIQNTANGTALANQGCSLGIWTSGDNIIVRNWTIQNIYNRVSGTTTGAGGSTGDLFVSGGATSIKVCNNTLNNASIGAELNFHTTPLTPGITSWTNPASCQSNTFTPGAIFGNNTMDDHNWMSHVNGIGAPVIINNTFGPIGWSNWNNDNNDFHSDGYFVEGNSAASFKPYFITNYMSGAQAFPSGMFLFTDNGAASSGEGQQAVLVGNVMYGTGAAVTCCQGIGIQAVVTGNPKGPYQWYNNTTINFGFSVENYAWQVASPTIDVRNNIYMIPVTSSAGWFFHNEGTGWSFSTATINGNNYFGGRSFPPNGPFGLWTSNVLYPAWKTNCVAGGGTLCDTNSAFADPLLAGESSFASGSALTPSGFIPAANSAAANLGDNLASQCASIPNQCAGMPQTVGAGGSCGIGCIARPAAGRWTAGAFQLTSGSVAPNPPTGLAATVSASTVSLSWTASTGTPAPTAYTMYRGTVHGGPYTAITSGLTTTSTTDTPASGTYFYVIAAYIGGIVSSIAGNGTTATVTCTAACAFPTGAVFTIGGDSQAAFNGTFTSTGQPTGSTFTFASSTNASGTGGGAWQSGAESVKSNEVTVTTPATLTASFLHASLVFANQTVGTSSASQVNTFTNTSAPGGTITISGKSITGANAADFSFTDNCPSLLLSSVSCNFNVTFTPTAPGARVATLTVTDNASGSPQTSALSGTGVAQTPIVTLNPTSLNFGDQTLSTTSSVRSIILTNTGSGTLNITSVVASGDFAVVTVPVTNCGGTLAPLATCSLNVTFTPTATGGRVGAVTVTDNAAGSPHVANLSGNGITTKCAITGNVTLSGFGSVCQ